MTRKIYRNFVAVFGMLCLLLSTTTAVARLGDKHNILVVNSYHPTYRWTGLIMNGINSTLEQYKGTITIDVEYMDTKSITDEQHYENLYALYKHKSKYKQYDVIITTDNNALAFVLRHRAELYPNVPVVFCGIEDFDGSMLERQELITGVTEQDIFEPTVEIALKLHPSAKKVVMVYDEEFITVHGEDRLRAVINKFNLEARLLELASGKLTLEHIVEKVAALGPESVVIITVPIRNPDGTESFDDIWPETGTGFDVPVYVMATRWLGRPSVVGGKFNSGFHQGQAAAEMAVRILEGQSTRNIPVLRSGVDKYFFDYVQLKRFGISLSKLPKGSFVINQPESFYYLYKGRIWTVTAVILALTVMVIILSANILRRKRAEVKLLYYQKQLKSLASQLSLTEERERRRIATELHDRIGQTLVISKIKLQTLLKRQSFGQSCRELSEVCDLLDRTIQDTRSLTFDLSYPILYELGFEAAVAEWLAEQIEARHGIATEFEDDGRPKPLEEDIRVLLFRSVQEVLINVVKHARAHRVRVFSRRVDGRIHVDVEDDGEGFNLSEVSSIAAETGGFGLFSIRERLEQVGGRLEVDSEPGRGTKVMIVAPLKQ